MATPSEAFEQLHTHVRRYRLDTALARISRLHIVYSDNRLREMLPVAERGYWPGAINGHQLAYLAKALILKSNDYRSVELTLPEYLRCAALYNDAQAVDLPDQTNWGSFFLRMAFQQFPHQMSKADQLGRAWYLFSVVAQRPEFAQRFDIGTEFQHLTGLTIEEFTVLGFWVFVKTCLGQSGSPFFNPKHFVRDDVPMATAENIDRFLERTMSDYRTFREKSDETRPADPSLTFYSFNPLEWRPIVQTDRSGCVVPYPPFLLNRISVGIYYDLLDAYGEVFTQVFGRVFEAYVGDLLSSVYPHGQLIPERPYGRQRQRKLSTDWAVIEGRSVTLIECKVTRLTLRAKISADPELLRADLVKGVVKALRQLDRVTRDIRNREPGLEPFHDLSVIAPVVMLLDPFFLANSAKVREIITAELQKEDVQPFDYQIVSVGEIEPHLPLIRQVGLGEMLRTKMADHEHPLHSSAYFDFEVHLSGIAKRQSHVPARPQFEARWRELMLTMRSQFPELRAIPTDHLLARTCDRGRCSEQMRSKPEDSQLSRHR